MGNVATHELYDYALDDGRCVGLAPGTQVAYTGWLLRIPPVVHAVNSQGFRGPSRSFEKPIGTRRILLMGDSYTFGVGMPEEETIAAQLQGILGASSSRRVEVLNFGVPGVNLEETFEQYQRFASRWEHDVVLYLLFRNDLDKPLCDRDSVNRWEIASLLRNVYLARVIIVPVILLSGFLPGENEVSRLTSVIGRFGAASTKKGAELRVVALGNPVAGERRNERFEAWIEQAEVPLLDLSHLWIDRSNLIAREFHFNQIGGRRAAVAIAEWLEDE